MILNKYETTGTFPVKNFKKPLRSEPSAAAESKQALKQEESS